MKQTQLRASGIGTTESGDDLRVLVLDDVEDDRKLILRALKKQNITCSTREAQSKESFIRELEDFRPDIILSDYSMPSFTGLQAIKLVQESFSNVPVIIVTGTLDEETAVDCMKKGAADYVLKESLVRLGSAVTAALERKRLVEEGQRQQIELSNAGREWQETFDAMDSSVFLLECDQKIVRCNKATETILGRPSSEIIGQECFEIFHCLDHPINDCPFSRSSISREREHLYLPSDGKTFDVIVHPLFHEDGSVRGAVHVMNDITPLLESQKEIQESEERYRSLYDNAPTAFFSVNPADGTILKCNKHAEILLGYNQKDIVGMSRLDLYANTKNGKEKAEQIFDLLQEGKDIRDQELQMLQQNGNPLWISLTVSPILDAAGKMIELCSVAIDISERKKLEANLIQAHKMEAIGSLAGGIAHDFNNILSAVLGFTGIAIGSVDKGSPLEEDLQQVYTAGLRATALVRQILNFARKTDENPKPVRVDIIIEEVVKLLRSTIPTSVVIKDIIASKSLVLSNPVKIHQLIVNLCTNASHAMSDCGQLKIALNDIHLEATDLPQAKDMIPGHYLKLEIADTGCGIPKENIDSIFEPFFTTKGIHEGTGMGLATVHSIVEEYGGFISVVSEVGKGTVFSILLPATTEEEKYEQFDSGKSLPRGKERILFVDDEIPICMLVSRMLEGYGYSVTVENNSSKAIGLFTAQPNDFDLVITDMTMPRMTGGQLAQEMLKIRPEIPVIVVTGYSKQLSPDQALKLGVKAFIPKPFEKEVLLEVVRKTLDECCGNRGK